jgi:hypothetical protein
MFPEASRTFPDASTRPITVPAAFVTLPSARTVKPPADAPPLRRLPAAPDAPLAAPVIEPLFRPPKFTTERAMMLPFVPTRLPAPSIEPIIEPAAF